MMSFATRAQNLMAILRAPAHTGVAYRIGKYRLPRSLSRTRDAVRCARRARMYRHSGLIPMKYELALASPLVIRLTRPRRARVPPRRGRSRAREDALPARVAERHAGHPCRDRHLQLGPVVRDALLRHPAEDLRVSILELVEHAVEHLARSWRRSWGR